MIGKKERCISPWLGFLIIVAVCVVIAGGIFFEFKDRPRAGRAHLKKGMKNAAVQVNFPASLPDADAPGNKFIF